MPADAEKIDLSRYVAIGDSITAGYADGALYFDGQKNAYPNILAAQFKTKNGGVFNQAWMPQNSVGVNLEGNSKLGLKTEADSNEYALRRIAEQGDQQALYLNTYASQGPFHNLGVPGAKVINLSMSGYGNQRMGPGNFNPFFTRMASDPIQTSVLKDALLLSPTFFSLFVGNNDALAFALFGGTENNITPAAQFESKLREIIEKLMAHGAKGLIANLPSIKNIPYFTCLPAKGLYLTTSEAQNLTEKYYEQEVIFSEGDNYFLFEDTVSPGGLRQLKEDEFILLDLLLDADCKTYLKGLRPIPKKYTLTVEEIEKTENALAGYNKIIVHLAEEKKLAFADIYTMLKTAKPDRHYRSTSCNLNYSNKGVFSLDGLHPNGFGQALMTNAFIQAINQRYNTDILPVNALKYAGIVLPSHKKTF